MTGLEFWNGKRVFITGHTGFKGSWLCRLLILAGAEVTGYALEPPERPCLFDICDMADSIHSAIGDIRDMDSLRKAFEDSRPQIVIHLAAQPIVREGYQNPRYTYETNVMGTVNILECIRVSGGVKSFLNVTTDKVYKNNEWEWGYRENEKLDGFDPYSNSKSCSELVTRCYKDAFFYSGHTAVSTARAGNVIGGGDFARGRIIPDCVRAAQKGGPVIVRNPCSVRPYQHVLDPLAAYLMIARSQYEDPKYAGSYNVGPDEDGHASTGKLADLFCKEWGNGLTWKETPDVGPHEAGLLKLDCSNLKRYFNWTPRWNIETAVKKTVEWTKRYLGGDDASRCMDEQIISFFKAN